MYYSQEWTAQNKFVKDLNNQDDFYIHSSIQYI
jgi:hypothetical protein